MKPGAAHQRWRQGLLAVLGASMLCACSSTDDFFGGRPPPPSPGSSSSFGDRFRSMFGSSKEAPSTATMTPSPGTTEVDCPRVDIRQGASTLMTNAPNSEGAMSLRYQATFGRTARECIVQGGTLSIKLGVQGRVILGPAGDAGETTVPLRVALVKEGIEPKTVWSKLYTVSVSVPPGQLNVPFTHVVEDMAVPMPSGSDLDSYVIYVGFDPQGVVQEKKPPGKPAARPRAKSG
jgi:hypothetical protein